MLNKMNLNITDRRIKVLVLPEDRLCRDAAQLHLCWMKDAIQVVVYPWCIKIIPVNIAFSSTREREIRCLTLCKNFFILHK